MSELRGLGRAIDSVYFLVFGGWPERLESNRWHYARRWARHAPVTFLQPCVPGVESRRDETREAIPNSEILPITGADPETWDLSSALVQAGQVMQHMRERGHTKPLLWSYNPWLVGLFAALPAVARIYHATENHFDFADLPDEFESHLEASLRISDLAIAVSSGVADGIRSRVTDVNLALVENGCDTRHYDSDGPRSAWLEEERGDFSRVAVFAGTINARLDFGLIEQAATVEPQTLLVFAGPVSPLNGEDDDAWNRVLSLENVRHHGVMAHEDLAALYRSCDLGFIPYRRERLLVENGFPLKTLEMAATGLPVVSTHMKPIVGLASAIAVAEDDSDFLASFEALSRPTLTAEEELELLEVAASNDYDLKFEQVIAAVSGSIPSGRGPHTRLDDLLADLGYEYWSAGCERIVAWSIYSRTASIVVQSRIRQLAAKWLKNVARARRAP